MPIEGKCEKCGGEIAMFVSAHVCKEVEQLRDEFADLSRDLFSELKKSQSDVQDLRDLCRDAFRVIRDGMTEDRVAGIEVCILQGNLWRAANAIPLAFERCGAYLKTTTGGVSDVCGLRARHKGKCEKV